MAASRTACYKSTDYGVASQKKLQGHFTYLGLNKTENVLRGSCYQSIQSVVGSNRQQETFSQAVVRQLKEMSLCLPPSCIVSEKRPQTELTAATPWLHSNGVGRE